MGKKSLQKSILIMFITLILICIVVVFFLSADTLSKYLTQSKSEYAMSIAKIIAENNDVKDALSKGDPNGEIQTFVEKIRLNTSTEFIVVMDMNSIRYSHSNPSLIGLKFTGNDEGQALKGDSYISTAEGVSGKSIRAFTPIKYYGVQIGVVSVGFFDNALHNVLDELIAPMRFAATLGFIVSFYGAIMITSHIKKQIFNLEPHEIATVLQERETIINSIRDGIISINTNGKINLINNEAKRILGVEENVNPIGEDIEKYIPNTRLRIIMENDTPEFDREQRINEKIIITNRVPLKVENKVIGAMAFFRDRTDLYKLAEELTGVKEYAGALRARSHEFMNVLQTVGGLIELGETEKALEIISHTSEIEQGQMSILVRQLKSPELVGILLGKMSIAQESSISLRINPNSHLEELPFYFDSKSIITVVGNIILNAIDALKTSNINNKLIEIYISDHSNINIVIKNNGPKISDENLLKIFDSGVSTKGEDIGIGLFLVKNLVTSAGGTINVNSTDEITTFSVLIPRRSDG